MVSMATRHQALTCSSFNSIHCAGKRGEHVSSHGISSCEISLATTLRPSGLLPLVSACLCDCRLHEREILWRKNIKSYFTSNHENVSVCTAPTAAAEWTLKHVYSLRCGQTTKTLPCFRLALEIRFNSCCSWGLELLWWTVFFETIKLLFLL